MARTGRSRHQNGWIELTPARTWKAHWYSYVIDPATAKETRIHHSKVVGKKATMQKYKAEQELDKLVAPVNANGSRNDNRVTFGWFYDNRFKPMREGGWGPSTRDGNATFMDKYLRPLLGDIPLRELDLFKCQDAINKLRDGKIPRTVKEGRQPKAPPADGYCFDLVANCLRLMRSTLEMARKLKFITENPAEDVRMPACKPTRKPVIDKGDIVRLFKVVREGPELEIAVRDHLILEIGVFCGLTSSELFGLQWDCYRGDHIVIRNTAYHGKLHEWRVKKKTRFRELPIAPQIREEFERWKNLCPNSSPEALIFAGRKGPMWARVFLRKIRAIATQLEIKVPVTFQVMRRSCATRNQHNGSIKDVQSFMGHSSIETTANVYMQRVPESVKQMAAADVNDVLSTRVQ